MQRHEKRQRVREARFDFIMTFAVIDSDFGACELRDSSGTRGGARARVSFLNLSKFETIYFKV